MSSSTRSRLIAFLVLAAAVLIAREISIRRHEGDLDKWPRVSSGNGTAPS